MAKPTATKYREDSTHIDVHSRLLRMTSCIVVPVSKDADVPANERVIKFMPRNNRILREDWELCKKNKAFANRNLKRHKHPLIGGRFESFIALTPDKFDKTQESDDDALNRRLEKLEDDRAAAQR